MRDELPHQRIRKFATFVDNKNVARQRIHQRFVDKGVVAWANFHSEGRTDEFLTAVEASRTSDTAPFSPCIRAGRGRDC